MKVRPLHPLLAGLFVALAPCVLESQAQPVAAQLSAAAPSSGAQPLEARVDALFAPWDRLDSPGAAVGVIRDGELVYARGYGAANLEYEVPISPATVFHVASVSKHFTTFAIHLLAEDGLLSLDDDVRTFVPELADFGHTITLRHLIHHTSGLRDQWELVRMSGWRMDDVITQEHLLKTIFLQRELNFAPGAEHLYSNTGYTLLALVAERVSGLPFARFAEERIFEPLGMTRTHFHDDHRRIVPGRAYSYAPTADGGFQHAPLNYANVGATSLFTTVEDLARWDRNFVEPRVGTRALLEGMHERGVLLSGEEISYAHALTIGEHRGARTVGHGGADAGFRAHFLRYPDHGYTVVVLSNLASFNPAALARQVAELYLGDRLVGDEPAPAQPPMMRATPPVPISADQLAEYAGRYWSPELETYYTLTPLEGWLLAGHRRHEDANLRSVGPDRFEGDQAWLRSLVFERDDAGRVTGFRVTNGRVRDVRFERAPG